LNAAMNTGELSPTAAELDEEMFVFNYEHSYNSRSAKVRSIGVISQEKALWPNI